MSITFSTENCLHLLTQAHTKTEMGTNSRPYNNIVEMHELKLFTHYEQNGRSILNILTRHLKKTILSSHG